MQTKLMHLAVAGALFYRNEANGADGGAGAAPAKPAKAKAEVVEVTMSDGRKVEFAGKRKMLKETLIDGAKVAVRLDFRNGNTILFPIPDVLLLKAAGHGIEQKLGDETAGEEDVDDMQLAVEELAERLATQGLEGWSQKREGGVMSGTSALLKALVELTGKSVDEVKLFLKDKKQAEKLALRNSPKVKPIIDRLEAEKASKAANVDTDALLGQLGTAAG